MNPPPLPSSNPSPNPNPLPLPSPSQPLPPTPLPTSTTSTTKPPTKPSTTSRTSTLQIPSISGPGLPSSSGGGASSISTPAGASGAGVTTTATATPKSRTKKSPLPLPSAAASPATPSSSSSSSKLPAAGAGATGMGSGGFVVPSGSGSGSGAGAGAGKGAGLGINGVEGGSVSTGATGSGGATGKARKTPQSRSTSSAVVPKSSSSTNTTHPNFTAASTSVNPTQGSSTSRPTTANPDADYLLAQRLQAQLDREAGLRGVVAGGGGGGAGEGGGDVDMDAGTGGGGNGNAVAGPGPGSRAAAAARAGAESQPLPPISISLPSSASSNPNPNPNPYNLLPPKPRPTNPSNPLPSNPKSRERDRERQLGVGLGGRGVDLKRSRERRRSRVVVDGDELNVLIYAYLCESNFSHTAYSFRNEARLDSRPIFQDFHPDLPGSFPVGSGPPPIGLGGGLDSSAAMAAAAAGKKREEDGMEVDDAAGTGVGAAAKRPGNSRTNSTGNVQQVAGAGGLRRKASEKGLAGAAGTGRRNVSGTASPRAGKSASLPAAGGDVDMDAGDADKEKEKDAAAAEGEAEGEADVPDKTRAWEKKDPVRAVPRGELIRHMYKALMWDEVEVHALAGWHDTTLCQTDTRIIGAHVCKFPSMHSGHSPIVPDSLINEENGHPVNSALLTQEDLDNLMKEVEQPAPVRKPRGDAFAPGGPQAVAEETLARALKQVERSTSTAQDKRAERGESAAEVAGPKSKQARNAEDSESKQDFVKPKKRKERAAPVVEDDGSDDEGRTVIQSKAAGKKKSSRVDTQGDVDMDAPATANDLPASEEVGNATNGITKKKKKAAIPPNSAMDPPSSSRNEDRKPVIVAPTAAKRARPRIDSDDDEPMDDDAASGAGVDAAERAEKSNSKAQNTSNNGNGLKVPGGTKRKNSRLSEGAENGVGSAAGESHSAAPKRRKVNGTDAGYEGGGVESRPNSGRRRMTPASEDTNPDQAPVRPKQNGRSRRNSAQSVATPSETSGQHDDGRSSSQAPAVGRRILPKAVPPSMFDGAAGRFQPGNDNGLQCWSGHTAGITRVSWNPLNPSRLVTCAHDACGAIWDFTIPSQAPNSQALSSLAAFARVDHKPIIGGSKKNRYLTDVLWNPEGTLFLTVSFEGSIKVWAGDESNAQAYREGREFLCTAWNPQGNLFATVNVDGVTQVWDANAGAICRFTSMHHSSQRAYHVDWLTNDLFVTCGEDWTVVICSVSAMGSVLTLTNHEDRVLVGKFSPTPKNDQQVPEGTRRLLATGSDDKKLKIFDVDDLEKSGVSVLKGSTKDVSKHPREIMNLVHPDDIQLISWCPDVVKSSGKRLIASATMADRDSTSKDRYVIKMWDINSIAENKCLYTKADHKNEITALEFSPCGGLLASASEDGHLCVWDAETGVSKRRFKASNGITDVKWSPDGQHLAIAVEDGILRTVFVGDLF